MGKKSNDTIHKRRWRDRHPKKAKAQSIITVMITNGTIKAPDCCEICSKPAKTEAHHPNYNKLDEVKWLCRDCHLDLHKKQSQNRSPRSPSIFIVPRELSNSPRILKLRGVKGIIHLKAIVSRLNLSNVTVMGIINGKNYSYKQSTVDSVFAAIHVIIDELIEMVKLDEDSKKPASLLESAKINKNKLLDKIKAVL